MEEYLIIKACQKGKGSAQKALFDRYYKQMALIALRYVPQQMDAEELLSDAFIKCFRFIHQFEYRGTGSFKGWLSKIVINECLAFLRKNSEVVFSIEECLIETTDGNESAIEKLQAEELFRLIQKLPEGYRTVFNLYVIEGLTHREIGECLDISVNTSKTQYQRARKYLQYLIKSYEGKTGKSNQQKD